MCVCGAPKPIAAMPALLVALRAPRMAVCAGPLYENGKYSMKNGIFPLEIIFLFKDGMLNQIEELKQRIESSINSDFSIRDLPTLASCVSTLEGLSIPHLAISGEILLETRIGKLVNDLRRQLPEAHAKLGKRLKNLVKVWSDRLLNGQPNASSPIIHGKIPEPSNGKPAVVSSPKVPSIPMSPALHNGTPPGPRNIPSSARSVFTSSAVSPLVKSTSNASEELNHSPGIKLTIKRPRLSVEHRDPVVKKRKTESAPSFQESVSSPRNSEPNDTSSARDSVPYDGTNGIPRPVKRPEKVKTHEELVRDFAQKNPGVITLPEKTDVETGNVNCDFSLKGTVIAGAKDVSGGRGRLAEPAHPPGKGKDPVEDEIAEILKSLPPLGNDVIGWDCEDVDSGETASSSVSAVSTGGMRDSQGRWHGFTEAYTDQAKSGDKMVILPYIYFPFPPP